MSETDAAAPARRAWRSWRVVLPIVAVGLLGAVAAVALLPMTSHVEARMGPGQVDLLARPSGAGSTALSLPPLGRITADTHAAPVDLQLSVDRIDVEALQRTLVRPRPEVFLRQELEEDLPSLLRRFALRALGAGVLVGGVAGALVPRRRWPHAVAGAVGGLLGVALLLGWTWRGYDVDAFAEARFDGALARAPAILQTVQERIGDLEQVQGRVSVLSQQVAGLYAATESQSGSAETLILHVSDIHSNPLGLELAAQLAHSFRVDAVLDTGDITSFGLPIESRLLDLIDDVEMPYLVVPGNHDSASNRAALEASGAVVLLDGDTFRVDEVDIYGVGDPSYTATNEISTEEANRLKEARAGTVARDVRRVDPDVLAVHDVRQATRSFGWVPVVVAGHTHDRGERRTEGTVVLTVGSTGATGLGSFTVETRLPYEAQILRFDGDELVAVDYVTVRGVSGSFEIDRRVIDDADEGEDGEEPVDGSGGDEPVDGGEGEEPGDGTDGEGEDGEGTAAPARRSRRFSGRRSR